MSLDIPWQPSPEARVADGDDGTVLMNVRSGLYFALNPVAARIWHRLQQGDSPKAVLNHLCETYDVSEPRLRQDLQSLLQRLIDLGLVVDGRKADRFGFEPTVAEDSTPKASPRSVDPELLRALQSDLPPIQYGDFEGAAAVPCRRRDVAKAWLTLLYFDLRLRGFGFHRFYGLIRRLGTRKAPPRDPVAEIVRIRAAVDRAARAYFKQAWCLQRSAATAWLLRRSGLPADLAIGLRHLPFMAHAWVEIGAHVVNDDPRVTEIYQIIERC